MINVTEVTTAELVAFYNLNAEKPVKRFADRKTAERRVELLVVELENNEIDETERAAIDAESRDTSSLAAAVAKSWTDAAVKTKRSERSAVRVDGYEYRSVRSAFVALGLPLNQHIAFRMHLKQVGKLVDEGRTWEIIPLNY